MTPRVTSAPSAPRATAPVNAHAPASAHTATPVKNAKSFTHALGQARTHVSKAPARGGKAKQLATAKTPIRTTKGPQSPTKDSTAKGKSDADEDTTTHDPVKKPVATDTATKAKFNPDKTEPDDAADGDAATTEKTISVKDEAAPRQQTAEKNPDQADDQKEPTEREKQNQHQPPQPQENPLAMASQTVVAPPAAPSPAPVTNSKQPVVTPTSGLSNSVANVLEMPRAAQSDAQAPAIASSGKTSSAEVSKSTAVDAIAGSDDLPPAPDDTTDVAQAIPHPASLAVEKPESTASNAGLESIQVVKPELAHVASTGAAAPPAPQPRFEDVNHPAIATAIRGQLIPNGGTMQIRLNPPELGPMQINVKVESGVLSATFQTSNDQATKLLSHSLVELKNTLETQGVTINRLHVEQAPRSEASNGKGDDSSNGRDESQPQSQAEGRGSQQDQQRREMLQRMWRRIAGGGDPLDLVA